jgi:hypothetical protein
LRLKRTEGLRTYSSLFDPWPEGAISKKQRLPLTGGGTVFYDSERIRNGKLRTLY